MRLIWPCYENENVGRAMFKDWSGSQDRAGVRVESLLLCAREDGSVLQSGVACLSSPFRMKKKEKKRSSAAYKVRLRTLERDEGKG